VVSTAQATRPPGQGTLGILARGPIESVYRSPSFGSWLEPPQPLITLMVSLEDKLVTERGGLPRAWIAGLDDRPEVVDASGRHTEIDLKLTAPGAARVCRVPLRELAGEIVPLEQIFGIEGAHLAEELAEAGDCGRRFDIVERLLAGRLREGEAADPVVVAAHDRLVAAEGRLRVGTLAADLNVSRRHLSAKFHQQLGMPPKAFARLLRFHSVRRRIAQAPAAWADIAAGCGYADQAHLNRDFRAFAGISPTAFVQRLLPGGSAIGDDLPNVQDTKVGGA
jgi:AraC-like DNA-binding protein